MNKVNYKYTKPGMRVLCLVIPKDILNGSNYSAADNNESFDNWEEIVW